MSSDRWAVGNRSRGGRLGVWQGRQYYRPARVEDMTDDRRREMSRGDVRGIRRASIDEGGLSQRVGPGSRRKRREGQSAAD